ncbi:type VI secretion system protein TssA [Marinobacter sp. C2H3]|uniref:type VI secretion system protein TssA n=1 Tax=Marinobacter sp. C2H3 TaxID=3119003 RepID=UPI00300EBB84
MQLIEQHPYVEQVIGPLAGADGPGDDLVDDPTLAFLEDETMKVGSLAHTDIAWDQVEQSSVQLLADRSKHLKALGCLLLSLQQGSNGERFALSLYLLNRALDAWWSQAWPYPGASGRRARGLMFTQMLQRAGAQAKGLVFDGAQGDTRAYCLEVLDRLREQATEQGLPVRALDPLHKAINSLPSLDAQVPDPALEAAASGTTPAPAEGRPAPAPDLGSLTLDPGNERATRQSLMKVAELITSVEPANPLGYRMRRYAIWYGISAEPPTRDGQRTDLAAVSADRVSDYRDGLERAPDLALWQRIEQSLSVSPFWLDGHWLSARAAGALGHGPCADAIREDLRQLLERLPRLTELTFNDGTPFLGPEAADWLWAGPSGSVAAGPGASPWEQALARAREDLAGHDLGAALTPLEAGLADAREPRDRVYWRLASLTLLSDAGLTRLAAQQAGDLRQGLDGRTLDDWEPGLLRQLDRLAGDTTH